MPVTPEPTPRKSDRMARRELLYSVVRESMARAGVLSASYRFKVLSLDAPGRQFLVMVDLASSENADPDLLSEIETVITQRAKARHALIVSAVYWRRNDQVGAGAGRPAAGPREQTRRGQAALSQPAELESEPLPLQPPSKAPATARATPAVPQAPAAPGDPAYDPIHDDEMAAFRAALASGIGGEAPAARDGAPVAAAASGRGRGTGRARAAPDSEAMPGFQDTEVRDQEVRTRTLSPTQAGDLN